VATLRLPPANFSNRFAVKHTNLYYIHYIANLAIDSTRAQGSSLNLLFALPHRPYKASFKSLFVKARTSGPSPVCFDKNILPAARNESGERSGVSPPVPRFHPQRASRAFVPQARQIINDTCRLPSTPTESLCPTGPVIRSEGECRSLTIVVQSECRDIESTTFRQAVTDSGRLVLGQQ
jgi:hypothetical protein